MSPPPYHALLTLDHQALVLVHAADATDDVVVLVVGAQPASSVVVVATVVPFQQVRAVRLAGRLAHDLVNLDRSLVASTVIGLPQTTHVPAHRRLPAIVFLGGNRARI